MAGTKNARGRVGEKSSKGKRERKSLSFFPQSPSPFPRVSVGWWHLRLSVKILALLRLSINFFQLRLTMKLKINFFVSKS